MKYNGFDQYLLLFVTAYDFIKLPFHNFINCIRFMFQLIKKNRISQLFYLIRIFILYSVSVVVKSVYLHSRVHTLI